MNEVKKLNYQDIKDQIKGTFPFAIDISSQSHMKIYGIPRGGIYLALIMENMYDFIEVVETPEEADIFVDDIIDSGRTRLKYMVGWNKEFYSPYDKTEKKIKEWLQFPWEDEAEKDAEDIVTRYIEAIGDDPTREGVIETPARVVKSWKELYAGYGMDVKAILSKCFNSNCSEMVICNNIEFYSMCEHHMLPIVGTAHIGYIPNGKVVGLSKLARTVDAYARRLQIQEQMTWEIATAIKEHIPDILGCGVVVEAKHFCMCSRGINKQNSTMVTSALLDVFKEHEVRSEFLNLIKL